MARYKTLHGKTLTGEVHPMGGMVAPVFFPLRDGRTINPLQVAPWIHEDSSEYRQLQGIMTSLRGEWPCVPFGLPEPPQGMPDEWATGITAENPVDAFAHGYGANHDWELQQEADGSVTGFITYPVDHPIARLHRKVSEGPKGSLDIDLSVFPRRDCFLPVALHPTLRLPDAPGRAKLSFGGESPRVWTYPLPAEPSRSRLVANQQNVAFSSLIDVDGHLMDITSLPFDRDSEDLVLITGADGHVALTNRDENYRVTIDWDKDKLPSVMLWLSNQGRRHYPWNGRHRALGIEPLAGVFDLGPKMSGTDNPMQKAGVQTGVAFKAGVEWSIRCSIRCEAI